MSRSLSRLVAAAVLAVSGLALTSMAFDADAARVGKGSNAGRQSSNVTNQAPAASTTTQKSATAPAAASSTAGACDLWRHVYLAQNARQCLCWTCYAGRRCWFCNEVCPSTH